MDAVSTIREPTTPEPTITKRRASHSSIQSPFSGKKIKTEEITWDAFYGPSIDLTADENDEDCHYCKRKVAEEVIDMSPCGHQYHTRCLWGWAVANVHMKGKAAECEASGCGLDITNFVVQTAKSYQMQITAKLLALQPGPSLERREEATAPGTGSPGPILPRVGQQITPSTVLTSMNQPKTAEEEQKLQVSSKNTVGFNPNWTLVPPDNSQTGPSNAQSSEEKLIRDIVYKGQVGPVFGPKCKVFDKDGKYIGIGQTSIEEDPEKARIGHESYMAFMKEIQAEQESQPDSPTLSVDHTDDESVPEESPKCDQQLPQCAECYEYIQEDEASYEADCGHEFHVICLQDRVTNWLEIQSDECMTCYGYRDQEAGEEVCRVDITNILRQSEDYPVIIELDNVPEKNGLWKVQCTQCFQDVVPNSDQTEQRDVSYYYYGECYHPRCITCMEEAVAKLKGGSPSQEIRCLVTEDCNVNLVPMIKEFMEIQRMKAQKRVDDLEAEIDTANKKLDMLRRRQPDAQLIKKSEGSSAGCAESTATALEDIAAAAAITNQEVHTDQTDSTPATQVQNGSSTSTARVLGSEKHPLGAFSLSDNIAAAALAKQNGHADQNDVTLATEVQNCSSTPIFGGLGRGKHPPGAFAPPETPQAGGNAAEPHATLGQDSDEEEELTAEEKATRKRVKELIRKEFGDADRDKHYLYQQALEKLINEHNFDLEEFRATIYSGQKRSMKYIIRRATELLKICQEKLHLTGCLETLHSLRASLSDFSAPTSQDLVTQPGGIPHIHSNVIQLPPADKSYTEAERKHMMTGMFKTMMRVDRLDEINHIHKLWNTAVLAKIVKEHKSYGFASKGEVYGAFKEAGESSNTLEARKKTGNAALLFAEHFGWEVFCFFPYHFTFREMRDWGIEVAPFLVKYIATSNLGEQLLQLQEVFKPFMSALLSTNGGPNLQGITDNILFQVLATVYPLGSSFKSEEVLQHLAKLDISFGTVKISSHEVGIDRDALLSLYGTDYLNGSIISALLAIAIEESKPVGGVTHHFIPASCSFTFKKNDQEQVVEHGDATRECLKQAGFKNSMFPIYSAPIWLLGEYDPAKNHLTIFDPTGKHEKYSSFVRLLSEAIGTLTDNVAPQYSFIDMNITDSESWDTGVYVIEAGRSFIFHAEHDLSDIDVNEDRDWYFRELWKRVCAEPQFKRVLEKMNQAQLDNLRRTLPIEGSSEEQENGGQNASKGINQESLTMSSTELIEESRGTVSTPESRPEDF